MTEEPAYTASTIVSMMAATALRIWTCLFEYV
jgi:hypothetical protein